MIGTHNGTGRLMAMGTLFVSGPIYEQRTSTDDMQFVLPLVQRDGAGVMGVTAIWLGAAAQSFMHLHRGSLKPGKALDVTFKRIFVHNNELHGIVDACVLAPDRWPARAPEHSTGTPNYREASHP